MADAATGLSRDAFLSHVGQLAEEVIDVAGLGRVLVRELTGAQRAQVLTALAPAAQGAAPDIGEYQKLLLRLGLIDPADGKPLLDLATVERAMDLGASKVEALCSAVERLSGLSGKAPESAEKNSATTESSSSTSA